MKMIISIDKKILPQIKWKQKKEELNNNSTMHIVNARKLL